MTVATELPVLAIDIGGTKIAAALIENGRCTQRTQVATPRSGLGADLVAAIVKLRSGLAGARGIGVATTGIVRDGRLSALNPTTLPIEDGFPLASALAEQLGEMPTLVNDAQAAAWAEYRLGAGQGTRAMAFITVSTGIGGGLVVDGRLQRGRQGLAGHIGHIVADPDGPLCGCGRRGCIERLASGTALSAFATERLGRAMTAVDVFEAAGAGDAEAAELIDRAARLLARIITDSVALMDIDTIVMGGGMGLAPGFLAKVSGHLASEPAYCRRPLVAALLGADAGLIGAALLVDDEKFHHDFPIDG